MGFLVNYKSVSIQLQQLIRLLNVEQKMEDVEQEDAAVVVHFLK